MLGKSKNTTTTTETRSKIGTLIGAGAVFDGNLSAPETVRIDGIINGNCTCQKELILGAEGEIKGNISAQNVIISGKVDGDIAVQGKLELLSTGKILGNIAAKSATSPQNLSSLTRTHSLTEGVSWRQIRLRQARHIPPTTRRMTVIPMKTDSAKCKGVNSFTAVNPLISFSIPV